MKKIFAVAIATVLMMFGLVGLGAPASATNNNLTCTTATLEPHRALMNGDHINMDIVQNGKKFQVNAYVDRNIAGGYDTLGIRFKNAEGKESTAPLTKEEVESGLLNFDYSKFLSGPFTVEWVQFNSTYFNQDRKPEKFLECGTTPPTPVSIPHIQDYIGACDAESREAKFVLDNSGSNVDVTYVVDGISYVVAAGTGQHVSAGLVPAEGKTYVITAGDKTWSFEAKPCITPEPPVVDIAPAAAASIIATCGAAEVTLTNPEDDDKYTNRLTASFVVYVDGEFYSAHAVVADQTEKVSLTFPEDSGDHVVTVRTGPAFGDELLATATVDSNCVPPVIVTPPTEEPTEPPVVTPEPTEPPVTEPTEPVEPTTPPTTVAPSQEPTAPVVSVTPKASPEPVVTPEIVRTQAPVAELAHTGVDVSEVGIGVIILLAVGGLLFGASRAGKRRQK